MPASVDIIEDHVFGNLRVKIADITLSESGPFFLSQDEIDMDTILTCHVMDYISPNGNEVYVVNYVPADREFHIFEVSGLSPGRISGFSGLPAETVRCMVIGGAHNAG